MIIILIIKILKKNDIKKWIIVIMRFKNNDEKNEKIEEIKEKESNIEINHNEEKVNNKFIKENIIF